MAKKPLPTPAQIRQLLRYEPESGRLFWKERGPEWFASDGRTAATWNTRYAGKEAFLRSGANLYKRGSVFKISLYAHRVIWAISYGYWPECDIDHINGNRTDNRIENLRSVTRSENLQNQKRRSDNKSGHTGVSWCKRRSAYRAKIFVGGKYKELGFFRSLDDAAMARRAADVKYGFHPNHGREK